MAGNNSQRIPPQMPVSGQAPDPFNHIFDVKGGSAATAVTSQFEPRNSLLSAENSLLFAEAISA